MICNNCNYLIHPTKEDGGNYYRCNICDYHLFIIDNEVIYFSIGYPEDISRNYVYFDKSLKNIMYIGDEPINNIISPDIKDNIIMFKEYLQRINKVAILL